MAELLDGADQSVKAMFYRLDAARTADEAREALHAIESDPIAAAIVETSVGEMVAED